MSPHPTTPLVAAEAIVNLDGSGTWSIDGTTEQLRATTAPAAREEALRRTALAAAERGTAIELTAVLAGVPTFLRVSQTGEVTRLEGSRFTPVPTAPSPETGPRSQPVTDRQVPSDWAEGRPRWALAAVAGVLTAAAAVTGLLFLREVGDRSPSPTPTGTPATTASAPSASPSRSTVVPGAVRRKLDVTVTARKGGPLAAQVRATAAPTVVTVTLWRHGRIIAKRRLHLTVGRATWASGDVTFQNTGPGRYRWAVTAPGASRVTGAYTVPVKPAPRDHRLRQPGNTGPVGVTPSPTQAAAPSAPPSPPPMTSPPSTPRPSTPPPTTGTRRPKPHNGPVPGGDTNPPHPGPSP